MRKARAQCSQAKCSRSHSRDLTRLRPALQTPVRCDSARGLMPLCAENRGAGEQHVNSSMLEESLQVHQSLSPFTQTTGHGPLGHCEPTERGSQWRQRSGDTDMVWWWWWGFPLSAVQNSKRRSHFQDPCSPTEEWTLTPTFQPYRDPVTGFLPE